MALAQRHALATGTPTITACTQGAAIYRDFIATKLRKTLSTMQSFDNNLMNIFMSCMHLGFDDPRCLDMLARKTDPCAQT